VLDHPTGRGVGQLRGLDRASAGGEREGQNGDERVAGARVMTTLWAAGRPRRALAWTWRFEAVDEGGGDDESAGVWGRFVVELAGRAAALALVRRLGSGG
jgi:hypothetical protein